MSRRKIKRYTDDSERKPLSHNIPFDQELTEFLHTPDPADATTTDNTGLVEIVEVQTDQASIARSEFVKTDAPPPETAAMQADKLNAENSEEDAAMESFDIKTNETPEQTSTPKKQKAKPKLTAKKIFLIDFGVLLVALTIFAYFHHINPIRPDVTGVALPAPVSTPSPTPEPTPTQALLVAPLADGSLPEPTAEATPEVIDDGTWRSKWPEKFGELEITDTTYKSENINITYTENVIQNESGHDIRYHLVDIYITELKYFTSPMASGDVFGSSNPYTMEELSVMSNSIVAINDDHAGSRGSGVVVRDGVLYRESIFEDVCVLYHDGTMVTFPEDSFEIESITDSGAWQAWSFGPELLLGGLPMTEFNTTVPTANPRTAVGYYEPGHYCFVVVDGRLGSESVGMTMEELSQLMFDLGCSTAYNLDGGGTSQMTLYGETISVPAETPRKPHGILSIAEVE